MSELHEKIRLQQVLPGDIEKRSFEIITEELGEHNIDPVNELVVKRVIHTTADFDYAENLIFSKDAVALALKALAEGTDVVTDTRMAWSGISKLNLEKLGGTAHCFISDPDVAQKAKENGTTRATASMEKAAAMNKPLIFAIGNAPTALVRLYEMIKNGQMVKPALIIGVPVGFVNVVEAKELILSTEVPHIVARGRKGGSNVAAAIVNALLYQLHRE